MDESAMQRLSVTCVIALHREALLAYTTLLSIGLARRYAEKQGLSVEWVITLDNHDALTEKMVRTHPSIRPSDKIEIVCYGDLSLSRNHAIKAAGGEYIVCMDGDDYFSFDYIAATVWKAAKNKNYIVHPEYIFCFGTDFSLLRVCGPDGTELNSYALFSNHYYSSSLTAHRDIFLAHPFVRCLPGFGFEDWAWNCEARANGFAHRPAPGAVLFYRRKENSMCRMYAGKHALLPPSYFFSSLPKPDTASLPQASFIPYTAVPWKDALKGLLFQFLRKLPRSLGSRIYLHLKEMRDFRDRGKNKFPPAVQAALLEVARIDGTLYPEKLPPVLYVEPVVDERAGRAFALAWHSLSSHKYDAVYITPCVAVGGADIMLRDYIRTVLATGEKVLCVTTDFRLSDLSVLPDGCDVLELSRITASLPLDMQMFILARLVLQLAPSRMHVINDIMAFKMIQRYGQALNHSSRLFVSIFADSQDDEEIYHGAGADFLRSLLSSVSSVITDNVLTIADWRARFGLPEEYFAAVYRYLDDVAAESTFPESRNRVLWAGRLDREKRLDIACRIAEAMPELHFDFYGTPVFEKNATTINQLKALPNTTLHGKYNDFKSLPACDCFALLYTTQSDGLPNVLLEAVAAGLPVVAPDRGGVRDFITNETGWLVGSHLDVPGYVAALREVQSNSEEAQARWEKAADLLRRRHTEENFTRSLWRAYMAKNGCHE